MRILNDMDISEPKVIKENNKILQNGTRLTKSNFSYNEFP